MRLLIRFQMIAFLLISLLAFNGCKESGGENEDAIGRAEKAEDKWQKEVDEAVKTNKENLTELFDNIGEKSFTRLLEDDNRFKGPESLKFEGKSLEEIKSLLKRAADEPKDKTHLGIEKSNEYASQFINQRDGLLKSAIFSDFSKYKEATDSIISSSSTFSQNILPKNEEYVGLKEKVKELISNSQKKFKNQPDALKITSQVTGNEAKSTKNAMLPLFGISLLGVDLLIWILGALLLGSIALNILQNFKTSKLKQEIAAFKRMSKAREANTTAYQPKPKAVTNLSKEKVKSIFESSFATLLSSLNSEFSSSCVETVNIQDYKNSMLDQILVKSFSSESEAKNIIDQGINRAKSKITEKIDDCRDRNTAHDIIDNELEYSQFKNTKLEDEENRNLFSKHIANLKKSLAETTDAKELDRRIETARQTINQDVLMTIQKNSEYYISFFDTDGTVADSKKSKVRKRDSVVKFIIDPDDPNLATYTLLYDDSVMMKSGIQSYQGLLLPICKIDGSVDPNGSSIAQMGEDGTLVLSSGYWKVDKKLTIKII